MLCALACSEGSGNLKTVRVARPLDIRGVCTRSGTRGRGHPSLIINKTLAWGKTCWAEWPDVDVRGSATRTFSKQQISKTSPILQICVDWYVFICVFFFKNHCLIDFGSNRVLHGHARSHGNSLQQVKDKSRSKQHALLMFWNILKPSSAKNICVMCFCLKARLSDGKGRSDIRRAAAGCFKTKHISKHTDLQRRATFWGTKEPLQRTSASSWCYSHAFCSKPLYISSGHPANHCNELSIAKGQRHSKRPDRTTLMILMCIYDSAICD